MLEIALLLRLVPYLLAGYLAYKKGYKWLTFAMVYVACLSTFNFFAKPEPTLSATLASVFAFFILMHALDLKQRR